MQTDEQYGTAAETSATGAVMEPAERQQRLGELYGFLLALAREKRSREQRAPLREPSLSKCR
jgi:hypothetical protein